MLEVYETMARKIQDATLQKVSIKPQPMSVKQAVRLFEGLNHSGRREFYKLLSDDEKDALYTQVTDDLMGRVNLTTKNRVDAKTNKERNKRRGYILPDECQERRKRMPMAVGRVVCHYGGVKIVVQKSLTRARAFSGDSGRRSVMRVSNKARLSGRVQNYGDLPMSYVGDLQERVSDALNTLEDVKALSEGLANDEAEFTSEELQTMWDKLQSADIDIGYAMDAIDRLKEVSSV